MFRCHVVTSRVGVKWDVLYIKNIDGIRNHENKTAEGGNEDGDRI